MMYIKELVAAFAPHRANALVVSGRAGRYWSEFSEAGLDLPHGDPAMGGHAGFSLGLALAQPDRPVVLFDTEGDLLMNLGILATIAEQRPRNFYYFLMDNECYATTGGQPVPNAQKVAYDAIARACGIEQAYAFTEIEQVSKKLPTILANPGPVFVWNKVHPEIENLPIGQRVSWRKRTPAQVIDDTRLALGASAKR
jgi:thiamine pyrophosphate-dependent acetolactate synthase large subunit-like protein